MLQEHDLDNMLEAVSLSQNCPISIGAYSVGAIITDDNGEILATGYSRETSSDVHAEEVAIVKAMDSGKKFKRRNTLHHNGTL
jgi:diaminohydroxyphosphoribosylaminopyrimidine deaminase / 5-amino-6-(5-phosphoribosylamino)uracil reductase